MSSPCSPILPLEYHEAGGNPIVLPTLSAPVVDEPSSPVLIGVPEEEVERRIQIARDVAASEASERARIECERVGKSTREKVAEVVNKFSEQRAEYFRQVEGEVVQLALSIARKILQREAELDPTLLAALVRIALDQMQCGSVVRIRVAPADVELWRNSGHGTDGSPCWEIVADEALKLGDCVVETELGIANFGFEAQLRDVEESFLQLLAHRPDSKSRDAATA